MMNVQDLHLEKEILPLLDFTYNDFSREVIISMLKEPLHSIDDILFRQEILKGFVTNHKIIKGYSYYRTDMVESFGFIENFTNNHTTTSALKFQLLFSVKQRHLKRAKLIQWVLLFHKIHTFYITRLSVKTFPGNYRTEVQNLNDFLSGFNLTKYELLIREHGLKVKHIIQLTELILQKAGNGEFARFWKQFFLFEAYISISIGITRMDFTFPTFSETNFSLHQFYHPRLANPVKNSFATNSNVILLTGPNMSGKSTLLKAISLCVYLGHIGFAVPANKAELSFFKTISVAINLNDDMLNGYSHFMTEVINLKKVITQAITRKKCFAVFDELFRGTNMEDAVEISITTLKGLTKFKNSLFLISTHLHQLKEIEEVKTNKIATFYIDCELKNNSPKFTFMLKNGWSDLKVGRLLFENEGLNQMLHNL
ncbi:MAG: AAA family ATPase [Chitinophagaceae bacterium]